MAYVKGDLPQIERDKAAANKPLFLGENYARRYLTASPAAVVKCLWTQTGNTTDSDESDSDGPGEYACDDYDTDQTYPDAAQNTWYLVFDFGTWPENQPTLDAIGLLRHNLRSINAAMSVEIANNATFSSGLIEIASAVAPSTAKRMIFLTVKEGGDTYAQRITEIRYLRFKFTGTSILPRIGEVILSRRRQTHWKSDRPYDSKKRHTESGIFVASSGVDTEYNHYKNQRLIDIRLRPEDETEKADLEALFVNDLDGGRKPFVYIEDPGSSPSDAIWARLVVFDFEFPLTGPIMRETSIVARERGPRMLDAGI